MNLYVSIEFIRGTIKPSLMMTDSRIHDLRGDIATGVSAMCVLTTIRMRGKEEKRADNFNSASIFST